MKRVLLIGDAVAATGFARLNHAYLRGLQAAGWDVRALGLNYYGDPHDLPFKVYPCFTARGGDAFGVRRTKELVEWLRPDVVCVTNDPWNVPEYVKQIGNTPVVASIAVDGKNCRGAGLNGIAHAVFWTEFGRKEARLGGYQGRASVIPLGVDLNIYRKYDKLEARKRLGLPEEATEAYILGVVGRNQPRKRLDLTLLYFAEWIRVYGIEDAYLFLQVAPTGDQGYDLRQLGEYLGISNRIIVCEPADIGVGIREEMMAIVYSTFDAMLTTTQGEGWGLTHMEAMACGVPNIVPDWAALGEWTEDAAMKVRCSTVACTPNHINVVGGVMDHDAALSALQELYESEVVRHGLAMRGESLVARPEFRWEAIGTRFATAVNSVLEPVRLTKATG